MEASGRGSGKVPQRNESVGWPQRGKSTLRCASVNFSKMKGRGLQCQTRDRSNCEKRGWGLGAGRKGNVERKEINVQMFKMLREKGKVKNKKTKHERARQKEKMYRGEGGGKDPEKDKELKSQKRKRRYPTETERDLHEGRAQCLLT